MSLPTMAPSTPSVFSNSTSTVSQAPQPTEEIVPPGTKIPTTTSLLFGFLVSFLGLFIVFVAWGLASRYMMDRRRERLERESELMDEGWGCREPVLWDIWAVPGNEKWEEMMPLSVELRRTPMSPATPGRHGSFTSAEQLLHIYHGFGRRPFASPSPRDSPREPVPSASQVPRIPKSEEELQIAVLVAMPSSTSRTRDRACAVSRKRASVEGQKHRQDTDEMSDIAVGVTTIPWDKERADFG